MPPPALSVFCKPNVTEFINATCRVPSPCKTCGKAQMGSIFHAGVLLNELRDTGNKWQETKLKWFQRSVGCRRQRTKPEVQNCWQPPMAPCPSLICTDFQGSPSPSKAFSLKEGPAPSLSCWCLWIRHRGNSWRFQASLKFSCYKDRLKNVPCMNYPLWVSL